MRAVLSCWAAAICSLALAGAAPPALAATAPTAAQLLAKVKTCRQLSHGLYKPGESGRPTIPVCDAGRAIFWKADLDVDCDGQSSRQCNGTTDPWRLPHTALQPGGKDLDPATTPFMVVPQPSP